jgi:hypothetical protein
VGRVRGGKTWVALAAAEEELRRGNVVVYVDFEDDETGIVGRLLDLGAAPEAVKARFRYVHPDGPPSDDEYKTLLRLVEGEGEDQEARVSLVVVDSVGEWTGLQGVDGDRDTQVADWSSGTLSA